MCIVFHFLLYNHYSYTLDRQEVIVNQVNGLCTLLEHADFICIQTKLDIHSNMRQLPYHHRVNQISFYGF